MSDHPNVIVVCLDTFRADILGDDAPLGFIRTPNLDALRRESIVFDHAYGECQATIQMRLGFWTGHRTFPYRVNPGCRGLMSKALGWHRIPDERMTLSEMLFQRGYITGFVTDVFHMFKPNMNFHRGFMHWHFVRGQEADPVRCGPIDAVDIRPHVPPDEVDSPLHAGLRQYLIGVQDRRTETDWFTPQVVHNACRFLEDNHDRPPFFLWVDSFAPHEYWDPPKYYADTYYENPEALDFILPQIGQNRFGQTKKRDIDIARTKALYYGYCTFVDKWLGMLFNKLSDLRLWDDTVVMFVSDHGTELCDNGIFSKNINGPRKYNHQINWMMRLPGAARAGQRVEPFVLSHDLPATILDLTGAEPDLPIQGQSVLPLVEGQADTLHGDSIVCGWTERACVRDRDYALIVNTIEPEPQPLLFHTAVDPSESHDVAADQPGLVKERMSQLEDFLGASLPVTYAHQPDDRNMMTLRDHLAIRRELGLPTGLD